jgi:tetratricopeptide (TPR) repeat protein
MATVPHIDQLCDDQRLRWRRGKRTPVEVYLGRYPGLHSEPERAVELLYNEILLRREFGEPASLDDYLGRFPHFGGPLRRLFEVESALGSSSLLGSSTAARESADPGGMPEVAGYELHDELGRGGMGIVYRARHVRLGRVVALKLIRAGAVAEPKELARFRAEAEAQARLQHPNIVPVYEVGDAGGRPYFALEFLEGGSLDGRLAGVPYPPRQAAALAETLARAIQHAHARNLVHRDLKPANILLTGDGIPKITDFGLAKQLELNGAGPTQSGELLGTPSYMAPEQTEGRPDAIGPAVDVYALGVILYELLTGRPPFTGVTPLDTLVQVRSSEPLPPSRVQPKVPRDLEAVCLKCLEKERHRRYGTAQALADDLARFVRGEATHARPVAGWERGLKWARRRPALAALLSVSALGAATLLAVVLAYNARLAGALAATNEQRGFAEDHLRLARLALDGYITRTANDERLKAQDLEPLRRDLLSSAASLYASLAAVRSASPAVQAERGWACYRLGVLTREVGSPVEALRHFDEALGVFRKLSRQRSADPDLRAGQAICLTQLGALRVNLHQPRAAESDAREAVAILESLAGRAPGDSYEHELAWADLALGSAYQADGQMGPAEAVMRRACHFLERLARQHHEDANKQLSLAQGLNQLAGIYERTGRPDEAEGHYKHAALLLERLERAGHPCATERANTLNALGFLYNRVRRKVEARSAFDHAREVLERLVAEHSSVVPYQYQLAIAFNNLADLDQEIRRPGVSEAEYHKARAILERLTREHPSVPAFASELARTHVDLGGLYQSIGCSEPAALALGEGCAVLERVALEEPGNAIYRSNLAGAYDRLATIHRGAGRHDKAEEARSRARSHREALAPTLAVAPENELGFAATHGYLGALDLPDRGEASELVYLETHALVERQAAERPDDAACQNRLAVSHGRLGLFYAGAGRLRDALAPFGAARSVWERLASAHPDVTYYRSELAKSLDRLALTCSRMGQLHEAEAAYQAEVKLLVQLTGERPSVPEYRHMLALCRSLIGELRAAAGRVEQAFEECRQADEILTCLCRDDPEIPAFQQSLGQSHVRVSHLDRAAGRLDAAESRLEAAREIQKVLADQHPQIADFRHDLARTLTAQADLAASREDLVRAESALREAVAVTEQLVRDGPAVIAYQGELAVTRASLGVLYARNGRLGDALPTLEGARKTWQRLTRERPAVLQFALDLARCDRELGDLYRRRGELTEAETVLQEGRSLCERVRHNQPELTVFASVLGETLLRLGDVAEDAGERSQAGDRYAQAIDALAPIYRQGRGDTSVRRTLLDAYRRRAESLCRSGAHAEAVPNWERALDLAEGPEREDLLLRRMDLAMPDDPFAIGGAGARTQ